MDDFGAKIKNVMHEKLSAPTTLQRNPMKLRTWKRLLFEVFFFLLIFHWLWLGFVFVIATLEIFLHNHTWNIIISSKTCFVIIKIEINQTLVSHYYYRQTPLGANNNPDYLLGPKHRSQKIFQDLNYLIWLTISLRMKSSTKTQLST